jgi:hypothetical protein
MVFASLLVKDGSQRQRMSVLQDSTRFHKPVTQGFYVHLATAYAAIRECAVTKECYMIQSSCC